MIMKITELDQRYYLELIMDIKIFRTIYFFTLKEDVKSLRNLFESFGFKVEVENDLDEEKFLESCKAFSGEFNPGQYSMMIMAILAHGEENQQILTSCGNQVYLEDIFDMFDDSNSPGLINKPKYFIVQVRRFLTYVQFVTPFIGT